MDKVLLQPSQIRLRHIKLGKSTDAGAVQVLGQWYTPQDRSDINSKRNRFGAGSSYTRREGLEGEATLVFPNTPGNRARFLCLTNRSSYEPGDEWIEIYDTPDGDAAGDPLLVVTPSSNITLTRSTITITGYDALWCQKGQRETDAGFWCHAPRDVFEGYCRGWTSPIADDFTTTGRFAFSTSSQNTTDGLWTYIGAADDAALPGTVKLGPSTVGGQIKSQSAVISDGAGAVWRAEATLTRASLPTSTALVQFAAGGVSTLYAITMWQNQMACQAGSFGSQLIPLPSRSDSSSSMPCSLAIERRDRWVFFYVQGTLVFVLPAPTVTDSLQVKVSTDGSATNNTTAWVDSVLTRVNQSVLQRAGRGGDMRLPGSMPSGGLLGQYFDDHDLFAWNGSTFWQRTLDPTRDKANTKALVIRRLEPTLDFPNAAAFNVPVSGSQYFSARLTGAIYLDLDNYDYAVRFNSIADRGRVWIGQTKLADALIDYWTSTTGSVTQTSSWLKAGSSAASTPSGSSGPLNGQRSGWYPIIIEMGVGSGAPALTFQIERSDAVGTWALPASSILSPYGIINSQVRGDSHYEQLLGIKSSWGYQFTCAPKSLESGEFPGRCIPVVREGRDTDLIIDGFEGINPQTTINAEDTIATLRCDAQGIADPTGTSQLTKEAVDYTQIGKHMLVRSDYESLSDITYAQLLEQRARNLLALRGAPFEEIQVQPSGRRGLTDSFPLTGQLAKMNWLPGDGARVKIPELLIDDQTPRPMVEIQWPIRPQGRGRPAVKWRQRTRNFEQLFRKTARVALNNDRNYQTQLAILDGSIGQSGSAGGVDTYSRVALPANLSDIKKAVLIVMGISGTWTIEINGTSISQQVSAPFPYDVTAFIAKAAGSQQMYARLISGGASYQIQLRLLVAT